MATCFNCHKGAQKGFLRSHSNIKTKRLFKPNLHVLTIKFMDKMDKQVSLCSKCYKKIKNDFWEGKKQHFVPVSLLNQKKIKEQLPAKA